LKSNAFIKLSLTHVLIVPSAVSEQGLKIMAMLYLTPVLPLGLVSYMCGTTSMHLASFLAAKIASVPLYLLYTFIGASAHAFIKRGDKDEDKNVVSALGGAKQFEENRSLIVAGLVLSIVMMILITRHIRKELMKVRSLRRLLQAFYLALVLTCLLVVSLS
jgi:uncharacterized membrane protein YdjX (TVP38/TMEM64 family)